MKNKAHVDHLLKKFYQEQKNKSFLLYLKGKILK